MVKEIEGTLRMILAHHISNYHASLDKTGSRFDLDKTATDLISFLTLLGAIPGADFDAIRADFLNWIIRITPQEFGQLELIQETTLF